MFIRIAQAAAVALMMTSPAAAELDDSGLHVEPWIRETFKDLREDLATANAEHKRLLILIEQRGCIYCTKMHEQVFSRDDIARSLSEDYFVVRLNMFGDVEVTDLDGKTLPEKAMVNRWGQMFTPTMMFLPEVVPADQTAAQAAIAIMPGAFESGTTRAQLSWIRTHGYESGENFQKFVARQVNPAN